MSGKVSEAARAAWEDISEQYSIYERFLRGSISQGAERIQAAIDAELACAKAEHNAIVRGHVIRECGLKDEALTLTAQNARRVEELAASLREAENAREEQRAEIEELVEALREFAGMPSPYSACSLPGCRCTSCRFVEKQDEARAILSRYPEGK